MKRPPLAVRAVRDGACPACRVGAGVQCVGAARRESTPVPLAAPHPVRVDVQRAREGLPATDGAAALLQVVEEALPPPAEDALTAEDDASRWDVKAPGLVDDMPEDTYHADPVPAGSLSSTGARTLLKAPAKFRHALDHPPAPRAVWDLGKALHTRVLGVGAGYVVPVDEHGDPYVRWDTNRCKAQIAEIRAAGYVPLKPDDGAKVEAMAAAILAHPDARELLEGTIGRPEVSAFAYDEDLDLWLRARFDYLPDVDPSGLMVLSDLKSAHDASDAEVAKAIGRDGLHIQAWWYDDIVERLGLCEAAVSVLIVQEKDPPYLVNVVQPHPVDMMRAEQLGIRARRLYVDCRARDHWPGYSTQVHTVDVPSWQVALEERQIEG